MKQTENFFLKLFEGTDKFDYKVINENWQRVDDAMDELLNGGNVAIFPTMTIEKVENGYLVTTKDIKHSQSFILPKGDPFTYEDFTDEQLAELKGDPGTVQLIPLFVSSIEECTDVTKLYVLPDGYVYAYIETQQWKEDYTNLVPLSTVSGGGSIYNGKGYDLNKRLNSSAVEKDANGAIATGFIPVTKNSVLRVKGFAGGEYVGFVSTGNHICLFNSSYTLLTTTQQGYGEALKANNIGVMDDTTGIYTVKLSDILNSDDVAFMRVSTLAIPIAESNAGGTATDEDATKIVITIDEEISGKLVPVYQWKNTGQVFVAANCEDRIKKLEEETTQQETRLKLLEAVYDGNGVPEYWLNELEMKADVIQQAMETAGKNKSAFLWYTDAHWANGNSKMSPLLLKYLHQNTSMNKVNFGGDIVGDPSSFTHNHIKYVYEWRKAIEGLPNHHSVIGNHDNYHKGRNDSDVANMVYSFLLASEESADMVMGEDFYYYIDNPCEKTRYLYLDSGRYSLSDNETKFIIDALTTTPNNWHIIVISHIWFQYTSASDPTVGNLNASMQKALDLFDAYNARQSGSVTMVSVANSYNFTSCGGKVEFCIGGHIHVDHEVYSTNGIPVIITASDANQERSGDETEDCGTLGTTTESAVFGIIADYSNNKITVVGVGRGTSRTINY